MQPRIHSENPRRLSRRDGLTLVEIMVAISIMAIVAFGSVSGLLQSRKLTESSIYLNTATTIAQGYIEQMKNMEYSLIDLDVIPDLINQGQPDSLVVSPTPENPEVGDPTTDVANTRLIDINNTQSESGDDLPIHIYVYVDNITNPAAGVGDARRIIVRYEYTNTTNGANAKVTHSFYCIRSKVSTY